jgi:hypothetical protein
VSARFSCSPFHPLSNTRVPGWHYVSRFTVSRTNNHFLSRPFVLSTSLLRATCRPPRWPPAQLGESKLRRVCCPTVATQRRAAATFDSSCSTCRVHCGSSKAPMHLCILSSRHRLLLLVPHATHSNMTSANMQKSWLRANDPWVCGLASTLNRPSRSLLGSSGGSVCVTFAWT